MKKWILAGTVALAGCVQIPNYQGAVKTPPPANLVGNWQTMGPQKGLVSKDAVASLIITAQGDTLDCREWQRVIAKPGKVTLLSGDWVNVNNEVRVMPLELDGNEMHYDKLVLQRVHQPTPGCQNALAHENDKVVPANKADAAKSKSHHRRMMKNGKS